MVDSVHNLLTLRGALVRDPHAWSHYLTETIDLFGDEVEVVFASHHWPTWGNDRIVEFLTTQRDLYAYLHDQRLRLVNKGVDRDRDRRGAPVAARAGGRVERSRLLGLGEPEHQGDLPAVHGLVRR